MDKLYHLFEIFKESFLDFGDDRRGFFKIQAIASNNVGDHTDCSDKQEFRRGNYERGIGGHERHKFNHGIGDAPAD